ncbi:MAG: carboxypeptidase regulatory-like domain-containing protein [Anaerolineae bacterium]|nr:carboxypeptidase regulatory-like domain-containing protein [Anaerolineae bacterium]
MLLTGLTTAIISAQSDAPSGVVSGAVVDANGPVANAIVQFRGTPIQTRTDSHGTFTLTGVDTSKPFTISAWADGYYVGWTQLDAGTVADATVTLRPLPIVDNNEYQWFTHNGVEGSAACAACHREYREWQADAHAQSATNERFLTVYTGEDVNGQRGQVTQWGLTGALPPNPDKPYYGVGFQLDYPNRAGNCATCHTPLVSTEPNNQNCSWSGCHTDLTIERSRGVIGQPAIPTSAHGVSAEGITCEFCHKIGGVIVDPETKLPLPDMPGILSVRLYRPMDESEDVFFGTLIDITANDTYLPLQSESQFCAACHYGVFGGVVGAGEVTGGTVIYNSYGEWLDSPYSDPVTGKTCQDCHMPESSANWAVYASMGGLARDYVPMYDHTMLGVTNERFMQNAVTMTGTAQRVDGGLQVEVTIVNDQTGHDVPTDTPIRSMLLVVEARDADGNLLTLIEGSVNPDYSGSYAGQPGKTFAKVLCDDWTGETPTAAIWRPVTVVEDTRLAALASDTTAYTFDLPADEAATVDVRLIFRRAFANLARQKGWNDPDILMEQMTLTIPASCGCGA